MSEVMSLGGSRELAVIVSVVAQMSYHLLSGTGECDGTDVPLHGVFNLLCTNRKNRAGDIGSPLSRSVQPHSRSILVGLEAEPHLDASSTQPFGK
jgi:hypothetical protein